MICGRLVGTHVPSIWGTFAQDVPDYGYKSIMFPFP